MKINIFLTVFLVALFSVPADSAPLEHGQRLDYTVGNDVGFIFMELDQARQAFNERAAADKRNGLDAYESYVKWRVCQPEPNTWDFSYYEMAEQVCVSNGLKWVPFLIAPSAWATPKWFKNSEKSVYAVNIINDRRTLTQSIWNPHIKPYIKEFIKRFSLHFDHKNMQSVLLGASGDFGESIFPAVGNVWTYKYDGEYYTEPGWWCGDKYAHADFRNKMKDKYKIIRALNIKWKTGFSSFEQVRPFVPNEKWSSRARLDFIHWYTASMTDFTEFWVKTAVKYFPDLQVLICTGGDARPQLGADFSGQAAMAKRCNAGIRITNEASDYIQNFTLTRWVSSACKNYGIYFGFEPAGRVDNNGIYARIYNAAASGADELFIYDNPPVGIRAEIYNNNMKWLKKTAPQVDIAVFLPKTSVWLDEMAMEDFYKKSGQIRDYTDFDYLDETLILDGFLKNYSVLLWPEGSVTEQAVIEEINNWLAAGGRLYLRGHVENVESWPVFFMSNKDAGIHLARGSYDNFMEYVMAKEPGKLIDGVENDIFHTELNSNRQLILKFDEKPEILSKNQQLKIEPEVFF